MKIESSNIQLNSQHLAVEKRTLTESLKAWVGDQRPDFEGRSNPQQNLAKMAGHVKISAEALAAAQTDTAKQAVAADAKKSTSLEPRLQLLILMVEALTGQKIHLTQLEDVQPTVTPTDIPDPNQSAPQGAASPAGFGVEYDRHETRSESEQTSFSATGVVKTADGKEIQFNLELSMNRTQLEQTDVSLRLGDAKMKDPLVINFGGTAAQLTNTKFSFDLNADGAAQQISFVSGGSGFLALDKNADGKINNGSELFGPASGNGFKELAAYDQDKNGWIDESDAVYSQLKVWTKDGNGSDTLNTLAQKKIGAIFLGNISTPFDVKNSQNQLDGQIKSSGVYVNENGTTGTVQQIDLVV